MTTLGRRVAPLALTCLIAAGCGGGSAPSTTSGSSGSRGSGAAAPRTLASTVWQGMKIVASASAPASYVLFDGSTEQTVRPARHDNVQLNVTLSDAQTAVAIPYATVTATITRGSTVLDSARLTPMISASAAPDYVAEMSLPEKGTYQLALRITPPVSARHVEYQHVWLSAHRVTLTFGWTPGT